MGQPGIPSTTKKRLRKGRRKLGRSFAGAAVLKALGGRRRVLLVSDGLAHTSEQQFAPILRHAAAIARRTGLVFETRKPAEFATVSAADLAGVHAVGLKLNYDTPADDAEALAERLFDAARAAGARALVFDGDDDQSVLWPGVIEASDAYIKKHRFSDLNAYRTTMVGKSNLTDYVHRTYGVSFDDNIIPSSGGLSSAQIDKIVLGWNIALDDKIHDLAQDIPEAAITGPRDTDLVCRASVPPDVWTHGMRDAAVQAINALSDRHRVNAPTDRVPPAEYYREMLSARCCISPFGFGELCWRDFEAMLCGSLLIKPDMSHVTTLPDLFVPGETYLPVAWDYSDLSDVAGGILADEARRQRIVATARERLLKALTQDSFMDRFVATMQAAGVLEPAKA